MSMLIDKNGTINMNLLRSVMRLISSGTPENIAFAALIINQSELGDSKVFDLLFEEVDKLEVVNKSMATLYYSSYHSMSQWLDKETFKHFAIAFHKWCDSFVNRLSEREEELRKIMKSK